MCWSASGVRRMRPWTILSSRPPRGGFLFVQVKAGLRWSASLNSPLGRAIDQFVRQYLAGFTASEGRRPWERPLEVGRDRLLLVVTADSSRTVTIDFPSLLERVRSDDELEQAVRTQSQGGLLSQLVGLVEASWLSHMAERPPSGAVRDILACRTPPSFTSLRTKRGLQNCTGETNRRNSSIARLARLVLSSQSRRLNLRRARRPADQVRRGLCPRPQQQEDHPHHLAGADAPAFLLDADKLRDQPLAAGLARGLQAPFKIALHRGKRWN